ncbi:GGDEF domain-containing protein [Lichenibacterium ramalinae]|uniref:GGDEF domain-containing protein n=1 Tax=Lichenibacterium ramalinae TaxID=2316527 RepID=UPI001A92E602|nr:diguanylate cyclase [Lichenibacterium ramalinae]
MTGVSAETVLHTSDHWSAFYPEPRPCLADLLARGDFASIGALYADWNEYGMSDFGVSVQNWCVMPRLGRRLYLAIDAGPIYDDSGSLIAVVETVRDITAQHEQQRTLATLAAKDALTGLANRRTFDETLMAEVRRASRAGSPLSLLMLDVDCFKSFNDTYGHQRGDACLKAVAEAIQGAVKRAGDTVARYGGEEFSVILPDTDQSGAAITAQRIRRAVENLGLGHRGSSAAAVVTVSLGAATAVLDSLDAGELVKAADAALYCSKRAGRNRITSSEVASAFMFV